MSIRLAGHRARFVALGGRGAKKSISLTRPSREEGGGLYVAPAVHFDGAAWGNIGSLAATDNLAFSLSTWLKPDGDAGNGFPYLFVVDPEDTYLSNGYAALDAGSYKLQFQIIGGANIYNVIQNANAFSAGAWHHILLSVQGGATFEDLKVKLYIDDVEITDLNTFLVGEAPASFSFNGLPFWMFSDSFGSPGIFVGDAADCWVAPGVSLLDGGGDIPEATRRLFVSAEGKPVDPSGFPAGAILFSGNASTFATNQGGGGAFTLIGALTNASTSPSD